MLAESQRLKSQINSLQSQLSEFPDGKLICTHNGAYHKWYHSDGRKQTYIPRKNHQLIEKLATKKYLLLLLEDLIHEQKAIELYLNRHSSYDNQSEKLLNDASEYKELLSPFFTPISEELLAWTKSPYARNDKYPEQLIHKTLSGNYVRSKSESMIDMFLYKNKIPFRYECALQIEDVTFYPDFTIRHPKTGKLFYWEHFGLVDEPVYCQNMHSKLQRYTSHGIIPSIQLITTYETKEHPLSPDLVEKIIAYYFL